jgi:hypothetical protein
VLQPVKESVTGGSPTQLLRRGPQEDVIDDDADASPGDRGDTLHPGAFDLSKRLCYADFPSR